MPTDDRVIQARQTVMEFLADGSGSHDDVAAALRLLAVIAPDEVPSFGRLVERLVGGGPTCDDVLDRLPDLVAMGPNRPGELAWVAAHAETCDDCETAMAVLCEVEEHRSDWAAVAGAAEPIRLRLRRRVWEWTDAAASVAHHALDDTDVARQALVGQWALTGAHLVKAFPNDERPALTLETAVAGVDGPLRVTVSPAYRATTHAVVWDISVHHEPEAGREGGILVALGNEASATTGYAGPEPGRPARFVRRPPTEPEWLWIKVRRGELWEESPLELPLFDAGLDPS